jgi:sulfite reductase (ferredoxin)
LERRFEQHDDTRDRRCWPKETKAQKVERLKREKNPWNAWDEVRQFAREGRGSVLPEWTGTYFKWWGIYTQGDGLGVTGGKGGEGKASEYFMMRIGLPNGLLTSHQLHVIARHHGKVRARRRRHYDAAEYPTALADHRGAAGGCGGADGDWAQSPKGACGDVVRNVTGCPLAGSTGMRCWMRRRSRWRLRTS